VESGEPQALSPPSVFTEPDGTSEVVPFPKAAERNSFEHALQHLLLISYCTVSVMP
jgi:hypothetical protein